VARGRQTLRLRDKRAARSPPDGTDDVAFIAKLIEKYVVSGVADPKRVYVTGISNGGAMAMTLACTRAELFAAVASVIMNLTDASAQACHPARAVPMLMMNGTADPLIPYGGGRGTSRFAGDGFWSTEETLLFWRRVNGCDARDAASVDLDDRDTSDQTTVTRITSRCPQGRDVVLYRINAGGHRMPASFPDTRFARLVNLMFGPQNHDIDGAEAIWAFFKRFP
jgi:polyhydroxybutyrate depolymerase